MFGKGFEKVLRLLLLPGLAEISEIS